MAILSGLRALVVDDEPDLREITVLELESYGCDVDSAENGRAAFEKVRTGVPFDFVISDIRMPERNGVELLMDIQSFNGHRPQVYLVTGYADISREEAMAKGAAETFYKPVDWDEVINAIARYFGKVAS